MPQNVSRVSLGVAIVVFFLMFRGTKVAKNCFITKELPRILGSSLKVIHNTIGYAMCMGRFVLGGQTRFY
jgi:hypothetical protein